MMLNVESFQVIVSKIVERSLTKELKRELYIECWCRPPPAPAQTESQHINVFNRVEIGRSFRRRVAMAEDCCKRIKIEAFVPPSPVLLAMFPHSNIKHTAQKRSCLARQARSSSDQPWNFRNKEQATGMASLYVCCHSLIWGRLCGYINPCRPYFQFCRRIASACCSAATSASGHGMLQYKISQWSQFRLLTGLGWELRFGAEKASQMRQMGYFNTLQICRSQHQNNEQLNIETKLFSQTDLFEN